MPRCRIRYAAASATIAALLVPAVLALGGCVVVESDSRYRYGSLHGHAAVDAIHPGVTTRAWVVENLGQPSSTYVNEAGNEVLRYLTVREEDTEVSFFVLFHIDVSEEEIETLHIEIEEDWVKSFWLKQT